MPAGVDDVAAMALVDEAAVLDLAVRLVRIRTVHEHEGAAVEAPAAALVADVMTGFGWHVTVTDVAPGRPNVVAVIDGSDPVHRDHPDRSDPGDSGTASGADPARTLLFEGHLDVVTEGDPDAWSFDPYAGDVVAGRLRGRGSADMKSGVAAMIHAARAVQLGGFAGTLVVAALADEEGLMLGAKRLAADLAAGAVPGVGRVDGAIICEPEGGEACPVAKGAIRALVTLTGRMAHGAMPEQGRNPLPAAGSLLIGLSELERGLRRRHGRHPLLGEVNLTPTVVAGGSVEQLNVIPAHATVGVDIRTVPGVDHGELLVVLSGLAASVAADAGLEAEVAVLDDRPPVDTPVDHPLVGAMLAGHRASTGRPGVIGGVPGTTDGTILSRDAGIPTVVYGPGDKWIAHQADEEVAVAEIVEAARAYVVAARSFLRAGR